MTFETPKVSIIVPVYKVEKYLHRCLDSILAQTFTDWECILIDDGSPDNSGKICDEYATRDSRFVVIHQENKGSAGARNTGLEKCSGKYIIFVDSDDWVEADYLEELYLEAERTGADVVGCNLIREYGKKSILESQNFSHDSMVCLERTLVGTLSPALFTKIILRSVLIKNNINFVEGLNMTEDLLFSVQVFAATKKVSFVKQGLYHYIDNKESQMNNITENQIYQMIAISKLIRKHLEEKGLACQFNDALALVDARPKATTIFSSNKQVRNAFRNEITQTHKVLYKLPTSFLGKICIFCYLHKLFWLQALLIFLRSKFRVV